MDIARVVSFIPKCEISNFFHRLCSDIVARSQCGSASYFCPSVTPYYHRRADNIYSQGLNMLVSIHYLVFLSAVILMLCKRQSAPAA